MYTHLTPTLEKVERLTTSECGDSKYLAKSVEADASKPYTMVTKTNNFSIFLSMTQKINKPNQKTNTKSTNL